MQNVRKKSREVLSVSFKPTCQTYPAVFLHTLAAELAVAA